LRSPRAGQRIAALEAAAIDFISGKLRAAITGRRVAPA
jgi:hypothetical protein